MKKILIYLLIIPLKIVAKIKRESVKQTLINLGKGKVHHSLVLGNDTYLQIHPDSEIIIEENVRWKGNNAIRINKGGRLIFRKNVYFSDFVSINCVEHIEVGENSWIGEGSKLYDHNHAFVTDPEYDWKVNEFSSAPIIIGKNVKIYSNVTILKGVTIGDNCIIGANVTIYKDIPPFSLVINKSENIIKSLLPK